MNSDRKSQSLLEKVTQNWIRASREIGFEIICPFPFEFNGEKNLTLAFLPAYGSKNGMVLGLLYPPGYSSNPIVLQWAEKNDCFCSFLNIEEYADYDEDLYLNTLKDWQLYPQ